VLLSHAFVEHEFLVSSAARALRPSPACLARRGLTQRLQGAIKLVGVTASKLLISTRVFEPTAK
jgi:hypothetical protein